MSVGAASAEQRRAAGAGDRPPVERGLSFQNVSKAFVRRGSTEPFIAVRDVNLDIEAGRFVCLIGPSGSGKSTLLNMTSGLFQPSRGRVFYNGAEITRVNTDVGYITQADNLLSWRTLEDNVGVALEIQGVPRRARRARIAEVLEKVGLVGFEKSYPAQLSGGMRKRATLARTLIYSPETLLMDEPFGALDAMLKSQLQAELLRLWETDRKTVLFVTHDLDEAILLADEIVVFGTNPGRIVHREEVTFQRPRDLVAIRNTPEFAQVWQRLWSIIEDGKLKGDR
jgi:sulfonate transport system ATP-binding protein